MVVGSVGGVVWGGKCEVELLMVHILLFSLYTDWWISLP